MANDLIESVAKGWGKRQVIKLVSPLVVALGFSSEQIDDFASVAVALLLIGGEAVFSYINRRRLEASTLREPRPGAGDGGAK